MPLGCSPDLASAKLRSDELLFSDFERLVERDPGIRWVGMATSFPKKCGQVLWATTNPGKSQEMELKHVETWFWIFYGSVLGAWPPQSAEEQDVEALKGEAIGCSVAAVMHCTLGVLGFHLKPRFQ